MEVLLVEPGKEARLAEIGSDLRSLQAAVGGYIEAAYFFDDPVALICNEEGKVYVWGGYDPNTSFDCSGFVSWVVNNCGLGYDIGRLDAGGLYYLCTPVSEAEARPGDLVFFEHTFEGPWITHVGIYVGDGWMIHAGSPISYIKFMDSYYSDNFVGFGRLPAV